MTIAVDDFLAHYGVLGMHWGQRKAEPVSADPNATKWKTTPRQARENRQKFAGAAAIGAVSALGASWMLKQTWDMVAGPKLVAKRPPGLTRRVLMIVGAIK
jgi:hypothetical protein